jgi:hypothetical protein
MRNTAATTISKLLSEPAKFAIIIPISFDKSQGSNSLVGKVLIEIERFF